MGKRKAYLVIELDESELAGLPPHHAAIIHQEPPPVQTRGPWWPTEEQQRERRTAERFAGIRTQQAEAIKRGDLDAPEQE